MKTGEIQSLVSLGFWDLENFHQKNITPTANIYYHFCLLYLLWVCWRQIEEKWSETRLNSVMWCYAWAWTSSFSVWSMNVPFSRGRALIKLNDTCLMNNDVCCLLFQEYSGKCLFFQVLPTIFESSERLLDRVLLCLFCLCSLNYWPSSS